MEELVTREILVSELETIYFEDGTDDFELIHKDRWEQDGKSQYQQVIYKAKDDGKYYSLWVSRSGSPFTDWYYDQFEYAKEGDTVELTEMTKVEKTVVSWEAVRVTG
jgi:hypothetical protein